MTVLLRFGAEDVCSSVRKYFLVSLRPWAGVLPSRTLHPFPLVSPALCCSQASKETQGLFTVVSEERGFEQKGLSGLC